ncbi:two-component system-response regulator [Flammeovirgaceae bacterium 311]|nr:two-component system-response regulator [Flammeovirgaceae bacterium 311]
MNMKVIIIEDEQPAAELLKSLVLKLRPGSEVVASLCSVEESVEWLRLQQAPELIFCDIHLSDGSSFEIFRQVKVKTPVIFTTAFDQYAIEAFQVNSIDYLLKPIKLEAVAKAFSKYEGLQNHQLVHELNKLHKLLNTSTQVTTKQSNIKSRFIVKTGQIIKTISSEEVAFFLAEEGVVILTTFQGKRFIIDYTLDKLEKQLIVSTFFRVNRQLIVNIEAIKEVRPYFKGRLFLVLQPNVPHDIIISNNKATAFKEWLDL